MKRERAASPIAQAYARCKPAREALNRVGRSMECIEDKAGVITERFCMADGSSVILFSTPSWWDVYIPLTTLQGTEETLAKIAEHSTTCEQRQAARQSTG